MINDLVILDTIVGFCIDNNINSFAELCRYCSLNRKDWFKYVVLYHDFFYPFLDIFRGRYLSRIVESDLPYEDFNGRLFKSDL